MTYSTKVLVLVVVFSQMVFWNGKNCTNGEGESPAETNTGGDEDSKSCYQPYFKELCSEKSPCCFYDGKNFTCQRAREEGEECTHNALAYNTNFCFCKMGLYCVKSKCTSEVPPDTNEKFNDMIRKK